MSQTKQASKRKQKALSVSVLSVAGMSLVATTTGSEAGMPSPGTAPVQAFLGEEEISDVSLATFHLAGQENPGAPRSLLHLTRGGCGCGHGCGGCGRRMRRIRPRMRRIRPRIRSRMRIAADAADASDADASESAWVGGAEAAAGAAGSADRVPGGERCGLGVVVFGQRSTRPLSRFAQICLARACPLRWRGREGVLPHES